MQNSIAGPENSTISWSKNFFFLVKSEKVKFLHENKIEQDISDKK